MARRCRTSLSYTTDGVRVRYTARSCFSRAARVAFVEHQVERLMAAGSSARAASEPGGDRAAPILSCSQPVAFRNSFALSGKRYGASARIYPA